MRYDFHEAYLEEKNYEWIYELEEMKLCYIKLKG